MRGEEGVANRYKCFSPNRPVPFLPYPDDGQSTDTISLLQRKVGWSKRRGRRGAGGSGRQTYRRGGGRKENKEREEGRSFPSRREDGPTSGFSFFSVGEKWRPISRRGAASFGNGVNILAVRQSWRRRRPFTRGEDATLLQPSRGEMSVRRGRGENNTFHVCFRDKRCAEHLDGRRNEPREKQTASSKPPFFLQNRIRMCVYEQLSFSFQIRDFITG